MIAQHPSFVVTIRAALLLFFSLLITALPVAANTIHYYVATDGDDTWSGRSATKQADNNNGPFASIDRARQAIRNHRARSKLRNHYVVNIGAGHYRLEKPIAFNADDSGSELRPIIYQGAEQGSTIISGARPISNCQAHNASLLKCPLPFEELSKLSPIIDNVRFKASAPPFEVYANNKRMELARWPNRRAHYSDYRQWAYIEGGFQQQPKQQLKLFTDRIKTWPGTGAHLHLWPSNNWHDEIIGIDNIDAKSGKVSLSHPSVYALRTGARYYIRNLFEELDAPNEWFYNVDESMLYCNYSRP